MRVFRGSQLARGQLTAPAVAIGSFDGVHLGHRALVALAHRLAAARGGDAVALTFDPHPARVLAAALAPPLLTGLERRVELLGEAGADAVVVEPFTPALAALPAEEFARGVLGAALGAADVVVGHDFTFGHARRGTPESLAGLGLAVHVVPPVAVDGLVVSSTKTREFLLEGNLPGARLLLGRDPDVDGVVVRGEGRGRGLGYPTANVAVADGLLPPQGIYAVRVHVGGEIHAGAASLGVHPTFAAAPAPLLEVHLLDFAGDLYGRSLRVAFVARLREERRFASAAELVAQIDADVAATRTVLGLASRG